MVFACKSVFCMVFFVLVVRVRLTNFTILNVIRWFASNICVFLLPLYNFAVIKPQ